LEVFIFPEALQPWRSSLTFSESSRSAREFITPASFVRLSWDLHQSSARRTHSYLLTTTWLQRSREYHTMSNTKAEVEQEVGYYALPRRRKIFWGRVLMSTRRLNENSRDVGIFCINTCSDHFYKRVCQALRTAVPNASDL